MVSFISKFLFTATVTAPTFLSLGLIGVIKDSTNYFQLWDDMLENKIFPTSFEWWGINISFGFMLICLIGIKIFLYRKSNKHKEGKTIQVKSYSNLSLNSAEQIISSIGEFYQFNLSSCIRQQNSLTAQFVSFSLSNLANIFYPPNFYNN